MSHNKILIIVVLLIAAVRLAGSVLGQEQSLKKKNVPKAILVAFQQSYPKATIKGYAKETDEGTVVYEIESMEGTAHRDVTYIADGSVVSIEESLAFAELPELVRNAVTIDYPKAKVSMSEKVTKGSSTQYELVVRSGKQKNEVVYNADGSLAAKEKK